MSADFTLDPTLARDCHLLGELRGSLLLLMDNALLPWFIVVPRTGEVELCDLDPAVAGPLQGAVRELSAWVREHWQVDKLNIAAIGNVVRQLHVHVVGRRQDDYCWPGVVWGRPEKQAYSREQVAQIQQAVQADFGTDFVRAELARS
jgi:diadenosine tetraphosphate (Ap4A) HIT family hydrolase